VFIYNIQNRTEQNMHGLLNIHIQSNNYRLDGIKYTKVLEL